MANEVKHTPGPWVIDPCWDILGNTDDGNGMVCQITTDAVPRAEAEANARLIAAAPELLEACRVTRALVSEAAMTGFNCHDGDWAERLYANQARLSAAIAKATGGNHA